MPVKASLTRCAGIVTLLLLQGIGTVHAGQLEGRWRLVEQRYGTGRANLADGGLPLTLEFSQGDAKPAGTLRAGGVGAPPFPWPAFVADDGPRPVDVEELRIDPGAEIARARYRVVTPGDDLVLQVIEEYRVVERGRALTGTVTVTFLYEGRTRGSYVLHRRFERRP